MSNGDPVGSTPPPAPPPPPPPPSRPSADTPHFTVPIPSHPGSPSGDSPDPTAHLPVGEPTQVIPVAPSGSPGPYAAAPVGQPSPYAAALVGQPGPPPAPPSYNPGAPWPAPSSPVGQPEPDGGLGTIGAALLWVAVGWWVFFLVRFASFATRNGFSDTIVFETVDDVAAETVLAAVIAVAAAILLSLSPARRRQRGLWLSSIALAVVTLAVAIWRLIP